MTVADKDLKEKVRHVVDSSGPDEWKAKQFKALAKEYGKEAVVKCFSDIVDEHFGITKGD